MSAIVDRIVNRVERRVLTQYSDAHVDRLEAAGKFPKRIPLGPGRVGWSYIELMEWIAARKAERTEAA